MKKTVKLTSLVKAKNDLEILIHMDQINRLKNLFNSEFEISSLDPNIVEKEDQLVLIKEALQLANATTKDADGKSLNYYIYDLSKHNRRKADLLEMQRKVENSKLLNNEELHKSLTKDVEEIEELIKKTTDEKEKARLISNKRKLSKRSLSKATTTSKLRINKLEKFIKTEIEKVESTISNIKAKLAEMNQSTEVEVQVNEGFEIVVK